MKIASYNINGINGRIDNLLRWLEEAQPDVVCLQELKSPDNRFPEKEAHRLHSAEVEKHVRGWEHTSDHAPVWIKLND